MGKITDFLNLDKHHRSGRFIEACILCLLRKAPCHGYCLMEKLEVFGFHKNSLNISVLYRNLHDMEENGLVNSSWVESTQGPKKRTYAITDKGKLALDSWISVLKNRKERISTIIDKYHSVHKDLNLEEK